MTSLPVHIWAHTGDGCPLAQARARMHASPRACASLSLLEPTQAEAELDAVSSSFGWLPGCGPEIPLDLFSRTAIPDHLMRALTACWSCRWRRSWTR